MTTRFGIIGTGMMGCEHIRNLAQIDAVDVVAIADPYEASRQAARKACAGRFHPHCYEHYEDLLAREDVDAVVVATPNYTHHAVMAAVFQTDKHVLLEKPLATTMADCNALVAQAQRHRGLVWVALEYRYMAPIAKTLELLPQLGAIQMCAIREHRFPFLHKVGAWNRFNRYSGGTLVEKCCHFFDLMNLMVPSTPRRVLASGGQNVNHLEERYDGDAPDILDNAYVIVEYEGGQRAMLDLCMFAEGARQEQHIVVTGDRGQVEATVPGTEVFLSDRAAGTHRAIPAPLSPLVREVGFHHGASYLEHLAFLEALQSGAPARVTVEDGRLAVAIGLAAQQSIATGRPVNLSELEGFSA